MKRITAEVLDRTQLSAEDSKDLIDWSLALAQKTDFDPAVLFYPRTVISRALADGEPILYLPLHPVVMFESLAPQPGLGKGHIAMSLYRIGQEMQDVAHQTGYGEMYFITNDPDEVKATQKRGWIVAMHDAEQGKWLMKFRVQNPATAPISRSKPDADLHQD